MVAIPLEIRYSKKHIHIQVEHWRVLKRSHRRGGSRSLLWMEVSSSIWSPAMRATR